MSHSIIVPVFEARRRFNSISSAIFSVSSGVVLRLSLQKMFEVRLRLSN